LKRASPDLRLKLLEDGVGFWIHVSPRASREIVGGLHGDALRVAVRAAPVGGKANAACVEALARALVIRRSAIQIDARSTGRRKRVRAAGEPETLAARLTTLATEPRVN